MAEKKQLVLVVECTAALASYWHIIVSDYLEKVIRKFCGNEATVELALVQFNAHGSYSSCLVRRSGWARNVDYFFEWLSCMNFSGGGFDDVAIAEGLAEVLMMCPALNETQTQPTETFQRHCILVAASNPYALPTPVYCPPNKSGTPSVSRLFDAEAVAKSFPQSCVSLSVICPKKLPKLRAIYNAGKRDPSATAPIIDAVKNPHFLILISENFNEACAALRPPVITNAPSNQTPLTMDVTSVSEPPPTGSPVKESLLTQHPVSVVNTPLATVKIEPASTVSPVASTQAGKTYSPSSTSQELKSSNDNLQDIKPVISNIQHPLRPAGPVNANVLNTISQARPAVISGSGSAPLAGTAQVAPRARTMMAARGLPQQVRGMQSNNNMGTNVGLSQPTSSSLQPGQSKYVKIWEGEFCGTRRDQIVTITRLEAYRNSPSAGSLAEDWPSSFVIEKLISQDNMNSIAKQHAGKWEYIAFRVLNQHGFLVQMIEKKLYAVIALPSHTLAVFMPDKGCRMIGMLFPGDMPVHRSRVSSRVGPGKNQGADRGPSQPQLQGVGGQVSSSGPKQEQE